MKTLFSFFRRWRSFLLFQALGSIICMALVLLMDSKGAFQETFVAQNGIVKAIAFFVAIWLIVTTISVMEHRCTLSCGVAFFFVSLVAVLAAGMLAPFVPFPGVELSFSGMASLAGQIGLFSIFCLVIGLMFLVVGKALGDSLRKFYWSIEPD